MDSIHLHGAEDIRSAANTMRSAADTMSNAASTISSAVERLATLEFDRQIFWERWLERFEAAAARMDHETE